MEELPPASSAPEMDERSWSPREPEQPAEPGEPPSVLHGWLPEPLRGGRWDPGHRGLVALGTVAAAAAVVAGFVLLRGRPQEVSPPAVVGGPAASTAPGAVVVVDVDGKVRHPGIVRLPIGARVDDALRAAGGALPGASLVGLNLARKLADGEQVLVGLEASTAAPGAVAGAAGSVDLNTADVTALDALPGIGPVLAQHIVDWRTEHGRFASIDQLREVPGIGESKFASLKAKVRV
ncbi:MAG: competence protein ComEA [Actinomycetota bacterium]|nr:competence protein ComEA [Actinomycetota bacterium]